MKIKLTFGGKRREVEVRDLDCRHKKCLVVSSCNSPGYYSCRTRDTMGCPAMEQVIDHNDEIQEALKDLAEWGYVFADNPELAQEIADAANSRCKVRRFDVNIADTRWIVERV